MLKCKICNHEQPEISVIAREICRGCGKGRGDGDALETWDEFFDGFIVVDEGDYGIKNEPY